MDRKILELFMKITNGRAGLATAEQLHNATKDLDEDEFRQFSILLATAAVPHSPIFSDIKKRLLGVKA